MIFMEILRTVLVKAVYQIALSVLILLIVFYAKPDILKIIRINASILVVKVITQMFWTILVKSVVILLIVILVLQDIFWMIKIYA